MAGRQINLLTIWFACIIHHGGRLVLVLLRKQTQDAGTCGLVRVGEGSILSIIINMHHAAAVAVGFIWANLIKSKI